MKTSEAATLLNVSPNTLRTWERRFGFPKPQRTPGGHRQFVHAEIASLHDALREGLSISSAVSRAREGVSSDTGAMAGVLADFDAVRADATMETAIAVRPLDRAVEEILMPALEEVIRRRGSDSAIWAFAGRWAGDWLRRAQRLNPAPTRRISVLVGDGTGGELDLDTAHARVLELLLGRAGVDFLSLPVSGVAGLGEIVRRRAPAAIVLVGNHASDDQLARWVYAARMGAGPVPVVVYRRELRSRAAAAAARRLPEKGSEAVAELVDLLERRRIDERTTAAAAPARPGRLAVAD